MLKHAKPGAVVYSLSRGCEYATFPEIDDSMYRLARGAADRVWRHYCDPKSWKKSPFHPPDVRPIAHSGEAMLVEVPDPQPLAPPIPLPPEPTTKPAVEPEAATVEPAVVISEDAGCVIPLWAAAIFLVVIVCVGGAVLVRLSR